MRSRFLLLLPPLVAAALLAAARGHAAPVLEVSGDRLSVSEDPSLPAAAGELPPPPRGAVRAPRDSPASMAAKGPSVGEALRRALRARRISRRQHDRYRTVYRRAQAVRDRAGGRCRRQLGSVLATLDGIAARGLLTASRMPALFLQLRRNTEFWRLRPSLPSGGRVVFRGSSVVFQHYAGQGLQIQSLATFGRANALHARCVGRPNPATPCNRDELRRLLDDMAGIASRRGNFTTWEYFFAFGGGRPPWTSGMSQGTGIQALARGSRLLRRASYRRLARSALGVFERPPPVGVRVRADGGHHYLIYSFAPRLRVLNAFLQAVIGLFDYTKITGDPRGRALFRAGHEAARRSVPRYDTGSWSLYSHPGRESTYDYHVLVRDFLRRLCDRTGTRVFCRTAERFTAYLSNRPRPSAPPPRPIRCGAA